MSKELEALEDIILYLNANEPKGLYCSNIEIIKTALKKQEQDQKKLKALEIIKEKNVDISYFKYHCVSLDDYNENIANGIGIEYLIQEEFDLLKEVLL